MQSHPNGKALLASIAAENEKAQLTVQKSKGIAGANANMVECSRKCQPDVFQCQPALFTDVVNAFKFLYDCIQKARAVCLVVYLPQSRHLNTQMLSEQICEATKDFLAGVNFEELQEAIVTQWCASSKQRLEHARAAHGQLSKLQGFNTSTLEWTSCEWLLKVGCPRLDSSSFRPVPFLPDSLDLHNTPF